MSTSAVHASCWPVNSSISRGYIGRTVRAGETIRRRTRRIRRWGATATRNCARPSRTWEQALTMTADVSDPLCLPVPLLEKGSGSYGLVSRTDVSETPRGKPANGRESTRTAGGETDRVSRAVRDELRLRRRRAGDGTGAHKRRQTTNPRTRTTLAVSHHTTPHHTSTDSSVPGPRGVSGRPQDRTFSSLHHRSPL